MARDQTLGAPLGGRGYGVGSPSHRGSPSPSTKTRKANGGVQRLDLFAGAGGSTVGLKQAGFKVVGAIEFDPNAAKTYSSNHGEVALHGEDIRSVDPNAFRKSLGLRRGDLDLLNACPPCQGFSTLGSHDVDDERNDLVSVVLSFLGALLPRAFVIENVPGLRNDRRLRALLQSAKGLGYAVNAYVINATDFGVPQNRRRLIAIGIQGGSEDEFPEHPVELLPRSFRREPPPVPNVLSLAGDIEKTRDPVHRARRSTPAVLARIQTFPSMEIALTFRRISSSNATRRFLERAALPRRMVACVLTNQPRHSPRDALPLRAGDSFTLPRIEASA